MHSIYIKYNTYESFLEIKCSSHKHLRLRCTTAVTLAALSLWSLAY